MYVTSLSWKEGIKLQEEISKSVWFSLKKSPRGHLTPKYYTNTLHIQTLEVRFADHTQCLQAQTPTTELDSLGSLYVD